MARRTAPTRRRRPGMAQQTDAAQVTYLDHKGDVHHVDLSGKAAAEVWAFALRKSEDNGSGIDES